MKRLVLLVERVRRVPPLAADGALAAGFLTIGLLDYRAYHISQRGLSALGTGSWLGGWPALAFLGLGSLPLVFRRRWPIPVLFLTATAWAVPSLLHVWVDGSQGWAISIAMYTVGATYYRRWQSWMALATMISADFVQIIPLFATHSFLHVMGPFPLDELETALVFLAGRIEGSRRAVTTELELRGRQIEVEQERLKRLTIARERERIARDLHGLVVHGVDRMLSLARKAIQILEGSPAKTAELASAIATTGRHTLGELRRLLGLLRRYEERPVGGYPETKGEPTERVHRTRWRRLSSAIDACGRWLSQPRHADNALIIVSMSCAASFLATQYPDWGPKPHLLDYASVIPIPLSLLWRRRAPLQVFLFTTAFVILLVPSKDAGVSDWAYLIAVYTVGVERDGWRVIAATGLAATAFYLLDNGGGLLAIPGYVLVVAFTVHVGRSSRRRHLANVELERRNALLAELQEENLRRAVVQERSRVARDMHDVVAHSVTVMVVQAEGAASVATHSPARSLTALSEVQRMGAEAMAELESILGELSPEPPGLDRASLAGGRGIEWLVGRACESGLDVSLEVHGARGPDPTGVEFSVYRIVQEALTNVRKHAPGARAHVDIARGPTSVDVEVTNGEAVSSPRSTRVPGGGQGLVGMRERVAVFGGELETGPISGGGFRVRASLPLGGDSK